MSKLYKLEDHKYGFKHNYFLNFETEKNKKKRLARNKKVDYLFDKIMEILRRHGCDI